MWPVSFTQLVASSLETCLTHTVTVEELFVLIIYSATNIDGASAVLSLEQVRGHTARSTAAADGVLVICCCVTNDPNT